jgi:hypothetical protein
MFLMDLSRSTAMNLTTSWWYSSCCSGDGHVNVYTVSAGSLLYRVMVELLTIPSDDWWERSAPLHGDCMVRGSWPDTVDVAAIFLELEIPNVRRVFSVQKKSYTPSYRSLGWGSWWRSSRCRIGMGCLTRWMMETCPWIIGGPGWMMITLVSTRVAVQSHGQRRRGLTVCHPLARPRLREPGSRRRRWWPGRWLQHEAFAQNNNNWTHVLSRMNLEPLYSHDPFLPSHLYLTNADIWSFVHFDFYCLKFWSTI